MKEILRETAHREPQNNAGQTVKTQTALNLIIVSPYQVKYCQSISFSFNLLMS